MRSSLNRLPALARPCTLSLLASVCACSGTGTTTPSVNIPAPSAAPTTAAPTSRPAGPIVLFAVQGDVLAAVACHDGKNVVPSESPECMNMAPEGATVILDTGEKARLGPVVEVPCRGSEVNSFEGRKAESPGLAKADYALWPDTAGGVLHRPKGGLLATAEELAGMTALLLKETGNLFEVKPTLVVTSGLLADMDGDGAPDRAFGAFEDGRLYGVIAVFLAKAPGEAVNLSVEQFHYPKLVGVTELDGKGGRELLISGAFMEGIEEHTVTSAISDRLLALPLPDGKDQVLGMWGCRMF
jgi:hypothetical protein